MQHISMLLIVVMICSLLRPVFPVIENKDETASSVKEDGDAEFCSDGSQCTQEAILWKDTFRCEQLFAQVPDRPLLNESMWMLLRGAYQATVGLEDSTIQPLSTDHGFLVPIYAGYVPGEGPAVFAADWIQPGTIIWHSRQTATFSSADMYIKFLSILPRDLACDVMTWAYTLPSKRGAIVCDLDEGRYIHAFDQDDVEDSIVGVVLRREEDIVAVATREVEPGTEILVRHAKGGEDFVATNFS